MDDKLSACLKMLFLFHGSRACETNLPAFMARKSPMNLGSPILFHARLEMVNSASIYCPTHRIRVSGRAELRSSLKARFKVRVESLRLRILDTKLRSFVLDLLLSHSSLESGSLP